MKKNHQFFEKMVMDIVNDHICATMDKVSNQGGQGSPVRDLELLETKLQLAFQQLK